MNKNLSFAYAILIITSLLFACKGPAKEENNNNASTGSISLHAGNEKYVPVDTRESVVAWKGSNTFGSHAGYVYVSKGELKMENNQLVGGAVEVDMNTIEDDQHDRNNGVIDHLKDPDFFDVKKFPFSTIAITKVASVNNEDKEITGNLTIKDMTHPVTFPAKIEVKDGIIKANGKLVIDRTKWGVRYKSKTFFNDLADDTISDSIRFDIKIVARK